MQKKKNPNTLVVYKEDSDLFAGSRMTSWYIKLSYERKVALEEMVNM